MRKRCTKVCKTKFYAKNIVISWKPYQYSVLSPPPPPPQVFYRPDWFLAGLKPVLSETPVNPQALKPHASKTTSLETSGSDTSVEHQKASKVSIERYQTVHTCSNVSWY